MIRAYRLCKTRHVATAFTGDGARIAGGRWNSPGIPVVYASSTLSLATLEVLVHLDDPDAFARLFSWFSVEIPDSLIEVFDESQLPPGWCADETTNSTRAIGDDWARSQRSAVLAVPSIVTSGERNYLINPGHPRTPSIRIASPQAFRPDPRLMKG
ncbi:RES family NAD+ phosphorylase [Luteolibacter flavescens]|uniref:RES family NAD+ phosphorylase n=1 Tax=Luteolibacter flavescens TaxID=1859460 RepID=A0ABT3FT65_9BACT|nr:RES family NAD+ phosphorylase [Luteolibacter flavescens]MCW1886742.1 RES family NAD+ phosphorylase [Luteolibacter flavescens]